MYAVYRGLLLPYSIVSFCALMSLGVGMGWIGDSPDGLLAIWAMLVSTPWSSLPILAHFTEAPAATILILGTAVNWCLLAWLGWLVGKLQRSAQLASMK